MSEYHSLLESLHEKYGPLVRQDIGPHTIIHVFDPDDVKAVHGVTGKTPEVPPLQQAAQLYRQKRNLTLGLGNMSVLFNLSIDQFQSIKIICNITDRFEPCPKLNNTNEDLS